MRIALTCIVYDPIKPRGGVNRWAKEVVPRLIERGHEVTVLHGRSQVKWFGTGLWALATSVKLSNFDIIHAANFRAALPPLIAREKYLLTCHDLGAQMWKFRGWIQRMVIKKALHIIAPTKAVKKSVLKVTKVSNDKITVIYNGVATRVFKPLNLNKPDKPTVGYIGRKAPYKIKLIEKIRKHLPEKYQIIFCPENLTDEELCKFYNSIHLTIVPSKPETEGFSFATMESLACGTPVVTTNIEAIKEVAKSYAIYAEYDPKDFVRKIEYTYENLSFDEKFKRNAREYVKKNFSWDKYVDKLLLVYNFYSK